MKKSIRVITFCFMLILCAGGVRAQTYTPVPYNFGGMFEVTDDSVPIGQKPTDLSMDCLAANGYGQWTASYKTHNAFDSGSPGLFLLANALRAPTYSSATGVVSFRPFAYFDSTGYPVDSINRSIVKNVTNIKGRVRYVWPSADHQRFIIEGFDECPPNGNPAGLLGINLEFASYPYNTTYGDSNAYLGRDVIKAALPTSAGFINIPIVNHPLVSSAQESDPRDWFSLAMDTTNLYIVYEEFDSTGHYNIWEITEQLNNGTIGPEIKVASGGRRPTIAADERRALPDSVNKSCFDVSYITGFLPIGEHLTWYNYDGGRIPVADTMEMNKTCQDTAGGTWTYQKILHACMLDATWEGIHSSDTTPRAIYAIVTDMTMNNHLVMFKIKDGAQSTNAYYCDGNKITNHALGVNDGTFPVIDKPIRAFVNPYDGEKDDNFDEYHCMYQLARTYDSGTMHHRPLMMIHGAMVSNTLGPRVCLNYAGLNLFPGTVTYRPNSLHAFYADPGMNPDGGDTDNYVGAVNQMGIHCHWRCDSQHYYIRDRRMFDEDIEENTLATEDVYIGDGTSHGGNYTPTIQPGKTMTLWTDRVVPFGYIDTISYHIGESALYFQDTGVNHAAEKLVAGTGSDTSSGLVVVWNANIFGDTNSQVIDIKPLSSMDIRGYYYSLNGGVGIKLEGLGATMTGGTYDYPSSIASPAYLNLHGSAQIWPSFVNADSSIIHCDYDQSAESLTESKASVILNLVGPSSITNSIVADSAPSTTEFLFITDNPNWLHSADTTYITNTLIHQGILGIGSEFDAAFAYIPYPTLPIEISGGYFNQASILGLVGPNATTIENMEFQDTALLGNAIGFQNIGFGGSPSETYDPITISGCNFLQLPSGTNAIYALGYATDSDVMQNLVITGNTFNYADGTHLPHAAIEFEHSEGLITNNTIKGQFQYGIYLTGQNSFTAHRTGTTSCSNLITGAKIAGIYTDWNIGYSELNEILGTEGAAHITGFKDKGRIIYSNYSGNAGSGIVVPDSTGWPDLTGIHTNDYYTGATDIAAFDTIQNNGGNAQISLVRAAHILLGNNGEAWIWSNWCQNNILSSYSDDYCVCEPHGGGVSYVPLIVEDSGHSISELGKISHNYFGDSGILILPENQPTGTGCNDTFNRGTPSSWMVGYSTPVVANGFCYFADTNYTTWQSRPDSAVDCSISLPLPLEKTKKLKGAKTLSVLTDTSCQEKYNIGNADITEGDYISGDSVLMEYVETCYDSDGTYLAFLDLSGYGDSANYANFREWLKSVLWLGPMYPGWYCYCADDILESYVGIDAGANLNASLAVLRYLDSSGRCNFDTEDTQILALRHMRWIDTVNALHRGDTIDFPEDTTVPTIDELGLGILRGLPAGVQNDTTPQTGITNLTASENPFDKQTTISFTMGEYAYVSFQVYDVLGRVVQGDYKGSVQGPGEYQFNIDGMNLADGTYYARITTPTGITRTIKLVKE